MTKLEQAARQALEAFGGYDSDFNTKHYDLIVALREALAEQAEQEPVGYVQYFGNKLCFRESAKNGWYPVFLNAAPQPVQSLTAQDLNDLEIETKWAGDSHEFERIVNAVVAKLKPVRTKDLTDGQMGLDETIMVGMANYIDKLGGDSKGFRAVIAADREKNK